MRNPLFYGFIALFLLCAPLRAQAEDTAATSSAETTASTPAGISAEDFKSMTPEERKAFIDQRRAEIKNMTPKEKAAFKNERKAKFENLSPEEKEQRKASFKARTGGRAGRTQTGE